MKSDPIKSLPYHLGQALIKAIQDNDIDAFDDILKNPALNPNHSCEYSNFPAGPVTMTPMLAAMI